jgi:hypothetical protein
VIDQILEEDKKNDHPKVNWDEIKEVHNRAIASAREAVNKRKREALSLCSHLELSLMQINRSFESAKRSIQEYDQLQQRFAVAPPSLGPVSARALYESIVDSMPIPVLNVNPVNTTKFADCMKRVADARNVMDSE